MTRAQADQILGALTRIQASVDKLTRIVLAASEAPAAPGPRSVPPSPGPLGPGDAFREDLFQTPGQSLTDELELAIEESLHSTMGASSREVCTNWREADERAAFEEEVRLSQERRASRVLTAPRMDPEEGGP